MTEQARRRGVAVEIDSFDEQVSRDHDSAPGQLRDHARVIPDSRYHAGPVLSLSGLIADALDEIEFVHEISSEFNL